MELMDRQRLWRALIICVVVVQTAFCHSSPRQDASSETTALVDAVMTNGRQTAVYYSQGNNAKALTQHQRTKALLQQLPPNAAIRSAFSLQAFFLGSKKFPAFIAEYSEIGFMKAILSNNVDAATELLGQTAAIYWTANDFTHAMQYFLQLGDFVEPLVMINPYDSAMEINQQSLFTKDFLRRYIRFMYNTYFSMHRSLCEQHNCLSLAWRMTEIIKSRFFRAQLLRSRLHRLGVMEENHARGLLQQIRETMIKTNVARYLPHHETDVATHDRQLVILRAEIKALLPEYQALVATVVSPEEISRHLTDRETFLSFLYTDNLRSVYVWEIESDHAEPIKLPAQTLPLYIATIQIKSYMAQDPTISDLKKALLRVHESLISPLKLKPARRLIIGVDQNLSALPFDLIPQPNGRLMMDDYDIVYTPSAIVFNYLRSRPVASEAYKLDYLGFSYIAGEQSKPDAMEAEVKSMADKFPHSSYKMHATESDLYLRRNDLRSTRYVHIVAHNIAIPRHNGDFYLEFGKGYGEDGQLTPEEIVDQLQNRASLIVLSACETAPAEEEFEIGEVVPLNITLPNDPEPIYVGSNCVCSYGESFSNLSGSFFAAGAQQLLVTQWQIPKNSATEAFVNYFFDLLSRGKQPGDALISAKRRMSQTYSPVSWAGFILAGQ
jgi:CHAT domain-containing protein